MPTVARAAHDASVVSHALYHISCTPQPHTPTHLLRLDSTNRGREAVTTGGRLFPVAVTATAATETTATATATSAATTATTTTTATTAATAVLPLGPARVLRLLPLELGLVVGTLDPEVALLLLCVC